jgi:hypothetical protein
LATHLSAEDVAQEHNAALGSELGPVFIALYDEVAWLHVKWQQYVSLFGGSEARIDLLNESAAVFFRVVEDNLWEDTLLSLCRLTEKPRVSGKEVLTVRRLPALLSDENLRQRVEARIVRCIAATTFARDWRNRHIAHRNLDLALQKRVTPLLPASRLVVKSALAELDGVLQEIHEQLLSSDLSFEVFIHTGGADALLSVLQEGVEAERARTARLVNGTPLPADLQPRAAV